MTTALDVYLPFDAGDGANVTEDEWRKMARLWLGTGPIRGEDLEMLPFGDSSGMQVKINTGKAWMRGHYGEITSTRAEAIADVSGIAGGSSRLDRGVLRVDFVNNRMETAVLTGTPATTGTQVAPAVTQSSSIWEISLGTVGPLTSATSTIAAGTVTDDRTLVDVNAVGAWTSYTPAVTGSTTNPTLGTGNSRLGLWRRQHGRTIVGQFLVAFGTSGTSPGSGNYQISLPVAPRALAGAYPIPVGMAVYQDNSGAAFIPCIVEAVSGIMQFRRIDTGALLVLGGSLNNDTIAGSFTIEAAA